MTLIPNNNGPEIKNLLIKQTELLKILVDDIATIRKILEKK